MMREIKMLIIIFGEMGMGKNFVGECLAREMSIHFLDGDTAIPAGTRLLHKADVDRFVTYQLIPAIESSLKLHNDLIVAQALYFEEHRKQIENYFKYFTSVKFIHVRATEKLQRERLLTREEGKEFWLPYRDRSHRHFSTQGEYEIIDNTQGKEEVIKQIKALPFYQMKESKPEMINTKIAYAK